MLKKLKQETKQGMWVYTGTREMSLCLNSLIVESYKFTYAKLGLQTFSKYYAKGIFICGRGSVLKAFFYRPYYKFITKSLKQKLAQKPTYFNSLFELTVQENKKVKKTVKNLAEFLSQSKLEFENAKKFYLEFRNIFLLFFPLQVFPFLVEEVLCGSGNQRLLNKYENILVKWRKKTHETEIELENLFSLFLNKFKRKFKIDFRYWNDYEMMKYFSTLKKPSVKELSKRRRSYLMIRNIESKPPYQIVTDKHKEQICRFLNKITKPKITGNEFSGKPIYKGYIIGKIYVARKKNDFKKIPAKQIVISRVFELDDLRILKTKKIKGVISEEGGITTHIAITGRELKVPIIAGVKGIMEIIKDGDLVEVDANKGVVKIIKRA